MKKRNKKAIIITAIVMLIGVLLILAGFLGNWFFGLFSKSFDSQNITSADIGRSIETDILVAYENIDLGDKTAQFVGNFNTGEGAFLLIDLSSLSEADKELYFSNYGQHITIKGTIKSVSDEELQEVFNKMYELYDPIFAERDSDMTLEEFHGYLTDPFIPYCIEITSIGTFNWTPFIPAGIIVFVLALVLEICFVFKLKKRIVLPVVCGLIVLIPVIMFFNHIRTMTSVKKVTDGLYTMENYLCTDTKGLLESDAHTVSDLFDWILDRHFYGLKVDINEDNFAFGCAAFAANTPEGDHLFGRNFDYMETDSVLVHSHPKGAYESIGVADLAVLGVGKAFSVDPDSALGKLYMAIAPYVIVDGMNEKGVGAGILELDIDETHQDNGNPDLLIFCAIRGILDNCASVDEALAFLRSYDIQTDLNATYHLFITDESGKYVVVEWLENEMVVTERACATNSVVAPGKHFDEGDPDDRLPTIDQCLGSGRVASEADAMKILAKVKNVRFTEWSCVYNLEKFKVDICLDADYSKVYSVSAKDF